MKTEPWDGTYPPDLVDTDFDYEVLTANDKVMQTQEEMADLMDRLYNEHPDLENHAN